MRPSLLAVVLALPLAAHATAQAAPCFAANDANALVTGSLTAATGQPNVRAFRVTLPAPGNGFRSIQIFTGNTSFPAGFMKLELWRNDPATNLPSTRHMGGTWRIDPSLGAAWQGTNLDLDLVPFPFSYWIVWTEPGQSIEPVEPGGTTFPTAQLVGGTWVLLPQPQALKVRLFCQWLEQPGVAVPAACPDPLRGCACPTLTGTWGTLFTNQPALLGNTAFAFEGTGFPAGALALLGLDLTDTPGFLSGLPTGCSAYPGNPTLVLANTGTGDVLANWATTGAAGHVTFPMPIPADPALSGLVARAQLAVHDPGLAAPLPFSLSNGLRIVIP